MGSEAATSGDLLRVGRGRRWPPILAVLVFILGMTQAWVGTMPFTHSLYEVCAGYGGEETTTTHRELSVWPPGLRCDYTTVDGSTRRSTFIPWQDYLSVALFAGAVGLAAFAVFSRGLKALGAFGLACGLVAASFLALLG